MGEMVTFHAANTGSGYLAEPAGGGPGVIVIQEWWGLNDQIKGVADRFAQEGFAALAPDMYEGRVVDEPDEAGKMMMALQVPQVEQTLRGAVEYLRERTGRPVGTIGFCMGGQLALFAATKNPEHVAACVDCYGIHPAVSPDWDRLDAPLLGIWPERDEMTMPNVPAYELELKSRGKPYEFVYYPEADHAFMNEQRPEVYREQDAEDAWRRSVEWFRRHLQPAG